MSPAKHAAPNAEPITCTPKSLPAHLWEQAAAASSAHNPMNHVPLERLMAVMPGFTPQPAFIAAVTKKYWHTAGVRLTVGFLDGPPAALKTRILLHMNAWAKTANVKFVLSSANPQVRIARQGGADGGYWSYVGTDILTATGPTMNLEAFTMNTPESEFHRVVRHETGHTLGFPHEHMRRALVNLIDPAKAIAYFGQTQGWSPDEVKAQVLTPIEESSLVTSGKADPKSIMCYQIPGIITRNGQPIVGGLDIDATDYAFAAKLWNKPAATRGKMPSPKGARKQK